MSDYWCRKLSCTQFPCAAFKAATIPETLEFCVMCGAEIERDKNGNREPHVTPFFDGRGLSLVHLECFNEGMTAQAVKRGENPTPLQKAECNHGPPERLRGCVPDGYEEVSGWLLPTASRTSIEQVQRRWKSKPGREGAVKEERSEVEDRP